MREYPVHHMWYGKGAGRTIEEIIDWRPDYFIWLVQTFLDVTPSQAAYFKKKYGMDLPKEYIRDVQPYIHLKNSPTEEYKEVCEKGKLSSKIKHRSISINNNNSTIFKSDTSGSKFVTNPVKKSPVRNKTNTSPPLTKTRGKRNILDLDKLDTSILPSVPEVRLTRRDLLRPYYDSNYDQNDYCQNNNKDVNLSDTQYIQNNNPYTGFNNYVIGDDGLIIKGTMCPAMREFFRNKKLSVIEPNTNFDFEGPLSSTGTNYNNNKE